MAGALDTRLRAMALRVLQRLGHGTVDYIDPRSGGTYNATTDEIDGGSVVTTRIVASPPLPLEVGFGGETTSAASALVMFWVPAKDLSVTLELGNVLVADAENYTIREITTHYSGNLVAAFQVLAESGS